jgi:hypothetical protein
VVKNCDNLKCGGRPSKIHFKQGTSLSHVVMFNLVIIVSLTSSKLKLMRSQIKNGVCGGLLKVTVLI